MPASSRRTRPRCWKRFPTGTSRPSPSFSGVPHSILYDNTKFAVARILPDGTRERTQGFARLISHYVFKDRFGRPGKGKDGADLPMLSPATAVLDWFGVIVFAVTGALVASRKQMDVVGFALL